MATKQMPRPSAIQIPQLHVPMKKDAKKKKKKEVPKKKKKQMQQAAMADHPTDPRVARAAAAVGLAVPHATLPTALAFDPVTERYRRDQEIWEVEIFGESKFDPALAIHDNLTRGGWKAIIFNGAFVIFARHPDECEDDNDNEYLLRISCAAEDTLSDLYIYEDELADIYDHVAHFAPAIGALCK